jgi:hypothetical protein
MKPLQPVLRIWQCCGSVYIESGSSISSEYGTLSGSNTDPEFGSRVLLPKIEEKNTTGIFLYLFLIKNCNLLIPRTSKLQEKASAPKKRTSSTLKNLIYNFFLFFWVFFLSGSGLRIWIRIQGPR